AALAVTAPPALEERKVVTVLFCDLVGFTAASDASDPEDVRARIRPYHARLRQEIERFGGTVEKFIGDAVMAVFGAPVAHEVGAGASGDRAGFRVGATGARHGEGQGGAARAVATVAAAGATWVGGDPVERDAAGRPRVGADTVDRDARAFRPAGFLPAGDDRG